MLSIRLSSEVAYVPFHTAESPLKAIVHLQALSLLAPLIRREPKAVGAP